MAKLSNKFLALVAWCAAGAPLAAAESTHPVWLVSNGFHSSLAVRAGDFPGARQLTGDPRAGHLLIGWGGAEFYRGRTDLWTICRSIGWPTRSALHVVPIRGAVVRRFPRSDVIRLELPAANYRLLLSDLDLSFARNSTGRPILLGPGDIAGSRFYEGWERFCLFKMCNVWAAQKLRRRGVGICVPLAITASGLAGQAARLGERESRRRRPVDAF